jgi:hypothetical protein
MKCQDRLEAIGWSETLYCMPQTCSPARGPRVFTTMIHGGGPPSIFHKIYLVGPIAPTLLHGYLSWIMIMIKLEEEESSIMYQWLKFVIQTSYSVQKVQVGPYAGHVYPITYIHPRKVPSPFKEMMILLSLLSFDFLALDCLFPNATYYTTVYMWALTPLIMVAFLWALYQLRISCVAAAASSSSSSLSSFVWNNRYTSALLRLHHHGNHEEAELFMMKLREDRAYYVLLFTYLVLPSVSLKLFQALDCITVANASYLRIDTSVSCDSDAYHNFTGYVILLVCIYVTTPLVWLVLLLRVNDRVNPKVVDKRMGRYMRDNDATLKPLKFLFAPYHPHQYYFEVIEM